MHASADGRHNLDPDLRLIHLHRMDYEICLARHAGRAQRALERARTWTPGWAAYNRIDAGEEFERWFYDETRFESEGIEIVLERDPRELAGAGVSALRRLAGRIARGADRSPFPAAASAAEHWQRVVMNEAVDGLHRRPRPRRA